MPTQTDAPKLTRLTEKEEKTIIRLYSRKTNPLSIRAIAEETGRSFGAIHRVLVQAGVERRGQGGTRAAKPKAAPVKSTARKTGRK